MKSVESKWQAKWEKSKQNVFNKKNVDKKLYVLECREQLLVEMMKFLKRTVLESDYVAQEKKKNKI